MVILLSIGGLCFLIAAILILARALTGSNDKFLLQSITFFSGLTFSVALFAKNPYGIVLWGAIVVWFGIQTIKYHGTLI